MQSSTTVIRATVHDAEGPWARRHLVHAIAGALALSSFATVFASSKATSILMACAFAVGLLARALTPRAMERPASLACSKGQVRVTEAGLLARKLRAKDIVGATTARHGDHFVISFGLRGREGKPIHFELATEDDVKTVCDALGIGHAGFGVVGFTLRARPRDRWEAAIRAITAAFWLLFATGMWMGVDGRPLSVVGAIFGVILANASVLFWMLRRAPAQQVVMRSDGAHVGASTAWRPIPYGAFDGVKATKDALSGPSLGLPIASKPAGWLPDGMSEAERAILVSQLQGAASRAYGGHALKEEGPATLEALRRNGASVGQWLAHLDAVAASLARGGGTYRSGTIDATDLWRALEDPDADPELRMAAGRLLAHLEPKELASRVSPLLETIRHDAVKKRIRVAIEPDAARAEQEMLALEEAELAEQVRASRRRRV